MFLTTHAAAGIAISQFVQEPWAVFGLSFASHFVLDFIPHGDEHLYRDVEWKEQQKYRRVLAINSIDLTLLIGLTLWAIGRSEMAPTNLMIVAILGSILPDFLNYFFPTIHHRFSWLFLVRWIYAITKPTGLRYLVRAQDWLHRVLHHEIIRRDIPLKIGIVMQVALTVFFLGFVA